MNPRGDFPLNDDWCYAVAARNLVFEHDWRPLGWGSMTLVTQSLWGASFCALTSCSYEALRASGLVAGALLLVASYALFSTVSGSRLDAAFAAAVVAFNPVLFASSYTFMTEIPFCVLLVLAIHCLLGVLSRPSGRLYALACLLCVAATLCRQLGLCAPLAFMITGFLYGGRTGPFLRRAVRFAFPLAVSVAALVAFNAWMRETGRLPAAYYEVSDELLDALRAPTHYLSRIEKNVLAMLLYLGLFASPLIFARRFAQDWVLPVRWTRWLPVAAAAFVTLYTAVRLVLRYGPMPTIGNVLVPQGIGPLVLRDEFILHLGNLPHLPRLFWIVVTLLSLLGLYRLVLWAATLLLLLGADRLGTDPPAGDAHPGTGPAVFALVCTVVYCAPLVAVSRLFDRYIAVILPVAILFVLSATNLRRPQPRVPAALAYLACAGLGLYAVLGTHDYLSWNRARWAAIADLERTGQADTDTLDGGFEFNGSRSYDPDYQERPDKSWWWVKDDLYQITFGPVPGLAEVARYSYPTFLPPGTRSILVLRRP